ncbi:MAG TPA: methylmalonyl-CoA mutase family protein, partial [Chloroflexota bacterium]
VDPLGGSFFVEALTDQLEQAACRYLDEIDALGGALRAIETGYFQRQVAESAYRYQQKIEAGDTVIVGVNQYTSDDAIPVELLRVDPALAESQRARLQNLKRRRDSTVVHNDLAELERRARGDANLVEWMVVCVEHGSTLGEISDTLRRVFGTHRELVDV